MLLQFDKKIFIISFSVSFEHRELTPEKVAFVFDGDGQHQPFCKNYDKQWTAKEDGNTAF
jgi:hypothetical protein